MLLDELVEEGATGAVALVDDGTRTTRIASGSARLAPRVPMRPDARVRVGSVTKTFVSTVALQLVGEGRLSLDDTVERWLPGLVPGGGRITLRQLLNHTSGLYNYTEDERFYRRVVADPKAYIPPRRLVAYAIAHDPLFAPGTGWSYSNTNYVLAGLIEERVTGRAVQRLLEERVIRPLSLSATSFPAGTWRIQGYHGRGYAPPSLTGDGYVDVTDLNASIAYAAGAAVSTVGDLRRFYGALLSGRLVDRALLAEMRDTVDVASTAGYGLGIYYLRGPCGTAWGHGGDIPGYHTIAFSDRSGRRSMALSVTTELDESTGPLMQLATDTAVCQMFGKVSSRTAVAPSPPGYAVPEGLREPSVRLRTVS